MLLVDSIQFMPTYGYVGIVAAAAESIQLLCCYQIYAKRLNSLLAPNLIPAQLLSLAQPCCSGQKHWKDQEREKGNALQVSDIISISFLPFHSCDNNQDIQRGLFHSTLFL